MQPRYESFVSLAIALGCGFLIGLQRQHVLATGSEQDGPGELGGVRTYPLYGLAGALSMLFLPTAGPVLLIVVLLVMMFPVMLAYWDDVRQGRGRGVTSEVTFVIAFLLGAVSAAETSITPPSHRWLLAAAGAVATTSLLAMKEPLHRFARIISREEMYDAVQFLVFGVMVLPFLPDESYGPHEALNPFRMGFLVLLMSSISFAGYVAVRWLGPGRGLGVAGLVGGLVSSTAVTLSAAGRSKREPQVADACALAIVLACSVMVVRLILEILAVNRDLLSTILPKFIGMLAAGVLISWWNYRCSRDVTTSDTEVQLRNPFELVNALRFAGLFAIIQLIAKAAEANAGTGGLYVASAVAGLSDVDAITLSIARMAAGGLDAGVAARCILIAVGANTLVKVGMAMWLGGGGLGRKVLISLALMLTAGWVVPG